MPREGRRLFVTALTLVFCLSATLNLAATDLDPSEEEFAPNFYEMGLTPEEEFIFGGEEIVVTAAKYAQKISESPSTIYVVTREDIRASGLTNLPDILRRIPGLDVRTIGASCVEINTRGFFDVSANKTPVMIDGSSHYDDTWSVVIWFGLPVVIEEIERIEVILGPGSALYGANAYGGLVNIITTRPKELDTLRLRTVVGNLHDYHSLVAAHAWDRAACKLSVASERLGRWRDHGESGDMLRCNGSVDLEPGPLELLRISGGFNKGVTELMPGPEWNLYANDMESFYVSSLLRWGGVEIKQFYRWDQVDFRSEDHGRNLFDFIPAPLGLTFIGPEQFDQVLSLLLNYFGALIRVDSLNVQAQYRADLFAWCNVSVGGDYRYYKARAKLLPHAPASHEGSGFVQAVLTPLSGLSATLTGRYDRYQNVGDHWSYRGSIIYSPVAEHSFRLSYGTAFRTPSYMINYLEAKVPAPFGLDIRSKGNVDLEPESIETWEIGYQGRYLEGKLRTQVTLFYSAMENFL